MGVPRVMSTGGPVPCLVGGAGFDGCVVWDMEAAERSTSWTVTRWKMSLEDNERKDGKREISYMITQELGGLGKQLVLDSGRNFYQAEAPTHCPQLYPFPRAPWDVETGAQISGSLTRSEAQLV